MSAAEIKKAANAGERAAFHSTYHCADDTPLYDAIKACLLAGRDLRIIDYPPEKRPEAVGAIARLCDELPIRIGWQTVRESRLSETRLRVRRYAIPGEFLRGTDHD